VTNKTKIRTFGAGIASSPIISTRRPGIMDDCRAMVINDG
jgi:hypothetical protein